LVCKNVSMFKSRLPGSVDHFYFFKSGLRNTAECFYHDERTFLYQYSAFIDVKAVSQATECAYQEIKVSYHAW
jgi:hypothetical protein